MIYQAVHKPVLLQEVLHYLIGDKEGIYVDCTIGEGGHSEAILAQLSSDGKLIGLDKDGEQLERARDRLKKYEDRCWLLKSDFQELPAMLDLHNIDLVNGILMDLGVSLYQLSKPERGFSFQLDGPLDMRFDQSSKPTAAELINCLSQKELSEIISRFGQEPWARRIAKTIVANRKKKKIETTKEFSNLICKVLPTSGRYRIHPATRTFQAIRIAVNQEIDDLEQIIISLSRRLKKGGRIVVISFHSLEDKQVKNAFRFLSQSCHCPPEIPQCCCNKEPSFKILAKRPIRASPEEIDANARSRSARMRVAERILVVNSQT